MAPVTYQENDGMERQCVQGLPAYECGENYSGESLTLALIIQLPFANFTSPV